MPGGNWGRTSPLRLELGHAMAAERGVEFAFGQFYALDQGFQRGVGRGALVGRKAFDGAGEVIGDGEHVAGEVVTP